MFGISADGAVRAVEMLLYSLSTALYLPVLLGIVVLLLHVLVCFGAFAGEWRERRRGARMLVDAARAHMRAACAQDDPAPLDARLERLVQRADAAGIARLDRVRFVVRVGPALGLMGTLIPMGISLAGLAQGNLPKMAESMTTAFTATVAGLACSVAAYVLALVREHWLRNDLADIAYAAEELLAAHQAGLSAAAPRPAPPPKEAPHSAPHLARSGG
jgi:biopolymer transport protein ExbB/TolQ